MKVFILDFFVDDSDHEDFVEAESEDETESDSNETNTSSDQDLETQGEYVKDNVGFDDDGNIENFQNLTETDVPKQIRKGLCVRNQITVWENLLEMRIQTQKSLVAANKMPPAGTYHEIKREMGQEFTNKISETKKGLCNLLDKLIVLQNLVQQKYPETKKLGKSNVEELNNELEDEEIDSDTEDEGPVDKSDIEDGKPPAKKRKVLSEYEKEISQNFSRYKLYRNTVIQKWHDKTRLTLMKGNTISQSIVDHIEHTLSDKTKLLKRTQLRRSDYEIIGLGRDQKYENDEDCTRISQIYNSEIFDDDDFYHQLLRELIEMKSAGINDPVQLGRQWIQLQNLRSKMKRKIDTKATKGRKIRYTVHTKLINFMAPIDENNWTDEAKNELYSSLFGKKQILNS